MSHEVWEGLLRNPRLCASATLSIQLEKGHPVIAGVRRCEFGPR